MSEKIKSYRITETLSERGSTVICRAARLATGESVLLKILKADSSTKDERARFRREFEITSRRDLAGIAKALTLEEDNEGLAIVFEDIGGQPLDRMLKQGPLPFEDCLQLAIALVDTLGSLHTQHIIHKDIKPSNVIFNPATNQINLIGFGFADEIPERSLSQLASLALEGTPEYMSPEQTGRMNRPVDYRTDFYSFGVTLYYMLTGKLPFGGDDALSIVHSHIARTPVPPHEINSAIPEMVSRIVMKLLSKMAEDRYQSAGGLKADLEKCLRGLLDGGVVPDFEPGLDDVSDRLRFPEKLYGREEELDQLLHAFERVSNGGREVLLVTGYAGVGKTRLVQQIHKTVIEKQGYFIQGKFDQLQRNVPYFAWIQALTELVNILLMGSEPELKRWKEDTQQALGGIGGVLTDVIPNLELIIGPQQAFPELAGIEAQNRFNYVFLEFMKAIATKDRPPVIFLDDLQWIDAASLNLLETLMKGGASSVLVIGAYRDNEVDALHPLRKGIEALRKDNTIIGMLTLEELSEKTVNELLADTLLREPFETAPLTHLIYAKTGGNPFFLIETIKALAKKKSIFFDIRSRSWEWATSALQGMEIADNVVSLMLGRIEQLPPEARNILPLAACIGYTFDLHTLSIIAEQPEDSALKNLQPALREGLITPVNGNFKFSHDRIQQAAYSVIPDTDKKQVHLTIGRLLLGHMAEHEREHQLFTIVDHLNTGSELIDTRDERLELARLNLDAGSKAKSSGAFSAAAEYFEAGVGMLTEDSWTTDYKLAMELHTRASQAQSLLGNLDRTQQLFAVITGKATAVVDMVGAYESKMHCYVSRGELQDVLDVASEILEKLGMNLPGHPTGDDVARKLEETKSLYADIPIEDLINLPKMTDPNKLAIARIVSKAIAAAYIGRPNLWALFVLSQVSLSIKYGNAIESPYFYVAYAPMHYVPQGNFDEGYRFGKLALALLETTNNLLFRSKTLEVLGGHVWHFNQHLRTTLPYLEAGYQSGQEVGDLEYAGYNAFFYCCNSYFAGAELHNLEQVMAIYSESLKKIQAETASRWLRPFWQATVNLLKPSGDPLLLVGNCFDQEEMLPVLEQTHNTAALAAFYVIRLMLCYLFEDYQQAVDCAELAHENREGMLGMFSDGMSVFYDSLARIQLYPDDDRSQQTQILERVSGNQSKLKRLADCAPMNFLHKFYLVEAERMRLTGDMAALDYYDKAISFARENEYIQEEALANELAAKFWLGKAKDDIARLYLTRAYRCYDSWGAVRKVKDLEKRYASLIEVEEKTTGTELQLLDLSTLMKATRAISSEMEMDKLLSKAMQIVVENAGAQNGFLLLEQGGVMQIVAKGGVGADEVTAALPIGMDESNLVARSVVRFVARSKQTVVLDDAEKQGDFVNDPRIRHNGIKSLLCVALLSRGRLIGILYLENNLTTQAFTRERVQLLEMLLSQVAVSFENARVYDGLRESEERHRVTLQTAMDGLFRIDMQGRIIEVNEAYCRMTGYSAQELLTMQLADISAVRTAEMVTAEIKKTAEEGPRRFESVHRRKDSSLLDVEISAQYQPIAGGQTVIFVRDITERKRAEEALRRLNRELRAVSMCNQALLRATDEQTLLSDICHIVCDEAGYRMAWVEYAENDEARSIRPVAWAGFDADYVANAKLSWSDETERGRGPGGIAIRSGETYYFQDVAQDPTLGPWRDGALLRGYRSGMAVPLKNENGKAFGGMMIYSNVPDAFTPNEVSLMEELAGDLAFGINVLRTRAERKRVEREIALLSFALNNVQEAAYLIEENARFRFVNQEACRALGYSRDELLGLSVMDIDPDFPPERWVSHWMELKAKGALSFEGRHRTKDARIFPVEINTNYF
ncbi:MAG TPA: AAA family ATPase, partial [Syntrophorhabdales bacterium]|nr:AAA family ATPase [Syntrophorhabdales bacterium]